MRRFLIHASYPSRRRRKDPPSSQRVTRLWEGAYHCPRNEADSEHWWIRPKMSARFQFGPNVIFFLSCSTMSLIAGVRKACLFLLVLGVFAPRALAAFAVCQAGWEWVGDLIDIPISRCSGNLTDLSPPPRLPIRNNRTLVRLLARWRRDARDSVRSNLCSTCAPMTHDP